MSLSITVVRPDSREQVEVETGTTGLDVFGTAPDIVAMRVDGQVRDLRATVGDGAEVEPVFASSEDGLHVIRHSAAHITAQAVQRLFPGTLLGIGPAIENGFYYDFAAERPFTPEDLDAIEKEIKQIVRERQPFVRRVIDDAEAVQDFAAEPFKLELIQLKGTSTDAETAGEVGGAELTVYENQRRDGSVAWRDLCKGPHLPHTGYLKAIDLTRTSAAYWRGNQANPQLQRVYGTAWATPDELKAYQHRIAEAIKRDHRKLGAELDLFSFPDEIGSGLPVFHPKGAIVRMEMEEYSRKRHIEAGYAFVNTPHITKGNLFVKSKHLEWYADGMYPPMHMDEEVDEAGNVIKQGADYYLKPMNCPMHNLVFESRQRSYRELPLRLFEFGHVYRYEKSGVVHGLTRARGFTQDDAHIYCTTDQLAQELTTLLTFVLDLLRDYGLDDFYLELSTQNPTKSVGDDATWAAATETLRQVAEASGLALVPDPGGAAFYGPKISVQAKDAIGRTWQLSTIQLDFFEPELFNLEYTAPDGSRQRPVMIHRALFGSIERFFGVLLEHYAGAFPAWLAPLQVLAVPVAEEHLAHLESVAEKLRAHGVRVEIDRSDDRFGKKIRNAATQKLPFVLIAGGDDVAADAVSFRFRDGSQRNGVQVDGAVEQMVGWIRSRRNDSPTAELLA